jgi:hypothetical protein
VELNQQQRAILAEARAALRESESAPSDADIMVMASRLGRLEWHLSELVRMVDGDR